jgi:hypothetical protein
MKYFEQWRGDMIALAEEINSKLAFAIDNLKEISGAQPYVKTLELAKDPALQRLLELLYNPDKYTAYGLPEK